LGWNFCDGFDFEGVHNNATLGNYESKKAPSSDAEYTFERVQVDIVLMTPMEDDS
jgi:hypothetical protein